MERPGFESPLCAKRTNRSLYAIYSQMPLDNCVIPYRRMTNLDRDDKRKGVRFQILRCVRDARQFEFSMTSGI